jgi:hypothetical protein
MTGQVLHVLKRELLVEEISNCNRLIISKAGTDNIGLRRPTIIDNITQVATY